MIRKIQTAIEENNLFSIGEKILVAVSGGADSVSLLYALHAVAPKLDVNLTVVHLDHQLRGVESRADAKFVKELATHLGVSFLAGRANVRQRAERKGLSLEMAAREARYEFFLRMAKKTGARTVATAHTADDQAETVLLKLARGAGRSGLSGIASDIVLNGLRVVRPMLNITRDEIITFLNENQFSWREDVSNSDLSFLRNRVRHEIIPMLESRLNPAIKDTLLRTAEIFKEEDKWIENQAEDILGKCVTYAAGSISLNRELLISQPLAMRRRVLRRWLVLSGISSDLVSFDTVIRVDQALRRKGTGRKIEIGGGWIVQVCYGELVVMEKGDTMVGKPFRKRVLIPGETVLLEEGLRIIATVESGIVKPKPTCVGTLPAKASISRLSVGRYGVYVRSLRVGDRIAPLGMTGSKKLQDILVNDKVPSHLRNSIPIFESSGNIIWLPGYRVARGWEVKDSSAPAIQLSIQRI